MITRLYITDYERIFFTAKQHYKTKKIRLESKETARHYFLKKLIKYTCIIIGVFLFIFDHSKPIKSFKKGLSVDKQ